jgi:hypothetical protein
MPSINRYHGYLLVLTLPCVAVLGCTASQASSPGTVDIWLNEPVTTTREQSWPRTGETKSGWSRSLVIEDPCVVDVHFPSGQSVRSWSRFTIVDQEDGRVKRVKTMPLEQSTTFHDAVLALERIVSDMPFRDRRRIDERIELWKSQPPKYEVSSGGIFEDRVGLYISVRKDLERNWFLSFTFEYYSEEIWENRTNKGEK